MNGTLPLDVTLCSDDDSPSFIITNFPSSKYVHNQIAVCVVNCILIIPALLLNGVCAATILKSCRMRRRVCYFLILVQSVVDLLVATITIPLYTYLIYSELIGTASCLGVFAVTVIGLVPCGLSLAALCALTFERYLGVLHPISHRNNLSKKIFMEYILACTLTIFILTPFGAIYALMYYIGVASFIGASLLINAFAYVRIFVAVGKKVVQRRTSDKRENVLDDRSSRNNKRKRFLRETKLARSCALVVGIFYLCYLPGLVSLLYFKSDYLTFRVAHSWYLTNFALNSSVNSLIFFWKTKLLRKEAAKMLKIFSRR